MTNSMSKAAGELSDKELWDLCKADDQRAYETLFFRYSPKLHAVCMRYLDNEPLVEEIVMDVLFWLWQHRHTVVIRGELSAYLFKAARNAVISEIRKVGMQRVSFEEAAAKLIDSRTADYRLASGEQQDTYNQLLKQLSPRRREVFILNREERLSYAEIARKTNLSINTIENYMVAALKHFRNGLLGVCCLLGSTLSPFFF